ncbi:hypothetical protein BP6252_09610 [Coleophoma cylindrospora]|uniref:Zn(2)-C6 fungal-type domain-containing protein n=1 Tax=Coleophoma cylindrospora TaxID=1849047 RepID=A0A3D8QW26_9HELO|nr:hypothetical protein BP6252_09610 [Coleophoma cylindrospora]
MENARLSMSAGHDRQDCASSAAQSSASPSSKVVTLTHRAGSRENLNRKRRPLPKVRTGCLTCKFVSLLRRFHPPANAPPWHRNRRVKCDEGKPRCQRCIKYGAKCEGYHGSDKLNSTALGIRALLPKGRTELNRQTGAESRLSYLHFGVGFHDESDAQSFRNYLEKISKQLSGPFPNSLWERFIPQISEMEPFVRHAIMAIGALGKQMKAQHRSGSAGLSSTKDYQSALEQYHQSLRGMRKAIASGQQDLRKALLASLLIFCFESMLGNQVTAALHAARGLMLLHPWKAGNRLHKRTRATDILERELLETFHALDLQVLLFIDNRKNEAHRQTMARLNLMIKAMPPQVQNLEQARRFWQLIFSRNCHFNQCMQLVNLESIQEERSDSPWEGSAKFPKGVLLLSDAVEGRGLLNEEQLRYQDDIARWTSASTPLFTQIAAGTNECEKVCAAILQVQAILSRVMLAGSFITSEMAYDDYLPEFTTITTLCDSVFLYLGSDDQESSSRFHFDIGIVSALFLVGSRCRFDIVRRKALDILFSANIREGMWDSLVVGHITRWLRSIELENVKEGEIIPVEKRAILNAMNVDLFGRRALLTASQGPKDCGLERTTLITW